MSVWLYSCPGNAAGIAPQQEGSSLIGRPLRHSGPSLPICRIEWRVEMKEFVFEKKR
jgi:hypothetical protein